MSMESNKEQKQYKVEDTDVQEEFSFLQETIKKKPIAGVIANQLVKMAICGIIFGLTASIGFYALKPWAETKFPQNPSKVTIPEDEEVNVDKTEKPRETVVKPELTLDSYIQLNAQMHQVAQEAEKSIVEVKGIHGNEGWIRETYDTVNSVSGVIFADTGVEFLVLSNNSVLKNVENVVIVFNDGKTYAAKLKKQDKNLGIAIFGVEKAQLEENTQTNIKVAELGNSNLIRQGDMLIALGKPFGYSDGLGYGVASSVNKEISLADGDYRLLLSDIPGTNDGSGFFVNLRGEIVGIIKPEITNGEKMSVSNALAISSLKQSIEMLSNGTSVPYLGILGDEVTEKIENEQGIPRGVYVKNVETDSPAMSAGIQCGDVITGVESTEVSSLNTYQKKILEHKTGEQIWLRGKRRGNDGYVDIKFRVTVGKRE